jgi:lysine-specific demethylase 8/hypoxia-inducible factor 1-alpha inhibitor (HIF hydroxylase)
MKAPCSLNAENADHLPRVLPDVLASFLSTEDFKTLYRTPGIPIVIRGLLGAEPEWNLDYLCQQLGDREFPVRQYGWERYQQDKRQWNTMGSGVETQTMPFIHYAKLLQNGEAQQQDLYLGKVALTHTPLANSSALKQVEARLGLKAPVSAANLWVGLAGHVTCLHCDPFDGILMQFCGSKRVVLFPPSQLGNLYPFSIWEHLRHGLKRRASYSQVYPDRPDFDAFPQFKAALQHRYEVILQRGDALFIPVGWWHEVTTLGTGVVCSVNRFWSISPRSRALQSWNKWRIHLGSLLAMPHILWNLLNTLGSHKRQQELSKLLQRL